MKSAPSLTSCRTAARTPSMPLASWPKYHMWPPVMVIGRPQRTSRGVGQTPSRAAWRSRRKGARAGVVAGEALMSPPLPLPLAAPLGLEVVDARQLVRGQGAAGGGAVRFQLFGGAGAGSGTVDSGVGHHKAQRRLAQG